MILDSLASAPRWHSLHPGFATAFDFLRAARALVPAPGKHVLEPDRLWIIVEEGQGRSHDKAPLEFHRRFIDIQLVLSGDEEMGWAPLTDKLAGNATFEQARDIGFLDCQPLTWFQVPPGHFAIFYPEDAHAPLAGQGPVIKAIAKVAVEW